MAAMAGLSRLHGRRWCDARGCTGAMARRGSGGDVRRWTVPAVASARDMAAMARSARLRGRRSSAQRRQRCAPADGACGRADTGRGGDARRLGAAAATAHVSGRRLRSRRHGLRWRCASPRRGRADTDSVCADGIGERGASGDVRRAHRVVPVPRRGGRRKLRGAFGRRPLHGPLPFAPRAPCVGGVRMRGPPLPSGDATARRGGRATRSPSRCSLSACCAFWPTLAGQRRSTCCSSIRPAASSPSGPSPSRCSRRASTSRSLNPCWRWALRGSGRRSSRKRSGRCWPIVVMVYTGLLAGERHRGGPVASAWLPVLFLLSALSCGCGVVL